MMVEWVVRASLRNYQAVEHGKYRTVARFKDKTPIEALTSVNYLVGTPRSQVTNEVNEEFE